MSDQADTLAEQILADARKQAEPTKRRAGREAERIADRARESAERERQDARASADKEAEASLRRTRARTQLEVANIRRRGAEDILLAVRERAMQALAELARSDDYPAVLVALATVAAREMRTESIELVMRAEDREAHGPQVVEALQGRLDVGEWEQGRLAARRVEVGLSNSTVRTTGGLLVWTADGRRLCDQTFEARLARLWGGLREEVAEDLFAGDEHTDRAVDPGPSA
ncbi:MAG: V-type ATP synthase subunit E family protein [Candidatus Brocadiia bacterium]|jgi:vacuolar-type H+-ATPase subunit E/Vma4|nr:V-type ATP synthase subunit E family protein [Candidatus Brocadiia bacterium]